VVQVDVLVVVTGMLGMPVPVVQVIDVVVMLQGVVAATGTVDVVVIAEVMVPVGSGAAHRSVDLPSRGCGSAGLGDFRRCRWGAGRARGVLDRTVRPLAPARVRSGQESVNPGLFCFLRVSSLGFGQCPQQERQLCTPLLGRTRLQRLDQWLPGAAEIIDECQGLLRGPVPAQELSQIGCQ